LAQLGISRGNTPQRLWPTTLRKLRNTPWSGTFSSLTASSSRVGSRNHDDGLMLLFGVSDQMRLSLQTGR